MRIMQMIIGSIALGVLALLVSSAFLARPSMLSCFVVLLTAGENGTYRQSPHCVPKAANPTKPRGPQGQ